MIYLFENWQDSAELDLTTRCVYGLKADFDKVGLHVVCWPPVVLDMLARVLCCAQVLCMNGVVCESLSPAENYLVALELDIARLSLLGKLYDRAQYCLAKDCKALEIPIPYVDL
jgi:hypothetical protein